MSTSFDDLLSDENIPLDVLNKKVYKNNDHIYKPKSADGKNNVYKAVLKFIPWHENKAKSIIEVWTAWLEDPSTETGKYVDCPGLDGPLYKMWKKYKDSPNAADQKIAKMFSRRLNCYSLVQIIKDENQPELEGQIKIFKYGKKIKDKILAEREPELGEPTDPFNMLKGRRFILHITKQGDWDNYDSSKFDGSSWPNILIDGKAVDISAARNNDEEKTRITQYIKDNSPNLAECEFKPWDSEMTEYVNRIITLVENPSGEIINNIKSSKVITTSSSSNIPSAKDLDSVLSKNKSVSSDLDDLNLDDLDNLDEEITDDIYSNL